MRLGKLKGPMESILIILLICLLCFSILLVILDK